MVSGQVENRTAGEELCGAGRLSLAAPCVPSLAHLGTCQPPRESWGCGDHCQRNAQVTWVLVAAGAGSTFPLGW